MRFLCTLCKSPQSLNFVLVKRKIFSNLVMVIANLLAVQYMATENGNYSAIAMVLEFQNTQLLGNRCLQCFAVQSNHGALTSFIVQLSSFKSPLEDISI